MRKADKQRRRICSCAVLSLMCFLTQASGALQSEHILVITNSDIAKSVDIARYYCQARKVPQENILALSLGSEARYEIGREEYNSRIAEPVRKQLSRPEFKGKIRCLLTIYGVPVKVGNDPLKGKETSASVDSELSMVLFDEYDLYRWCPNALKGNPSQWDGKTLMVSRLDGPHPDRTKELVDKALTAERRGLKGTVYIDSGYSKQKGDNAAFARYDQSLVDLALLAMFRTELDVKQEATEAVFQPGSCPKTALYCGWYSVRKYVDAFDFVDGAIGYHIASFEAQELRDPNSTRWCPAMLSDGITATLGPIDEPYLDAFPMPYDFFLQLFDGHCLVEAFYFSNPFNSWQMVLIGDPLYTPFRKR